MWRRWISGFLLLSPLCAPSPAAAHAPLPPYNWKDKQGYRIDIDTISTISLLRCKEKVEIVDRKPQVIPGKWICEVEVSASAITYRDSQPKTELKRGRIVDRQEPPK